MVINQAFEEQMRKLISETQDELNNIEAQVKSLENRRLELAEELHSYELSLRGYQRRIIGEKEEQPKDWAKLLRNLRTHKERLLAIATNSDGELKFNSAVDILYNGKYMKSKSRFNAYVQLYQIVQDMIDKGLLKKVGRARYKLTH